mmetsp:Transcript_92231/g.154725  ORF Transcript_92231/g.154725 Transcript_92231/m.154725 type:complete len:237 (-) Transcript_92231:1541-2251(-)
MHRRTRARARAPPRPDGGPEQHPKGPSGAGLHAVMQILRGRTDLQRWVYGNHSADFVAARRVLTEICISRVMAWQDFLHVIIIERIRRRRVLSQRSDSLVSRHVGPQHRVALDALFGHRGVGVVEPIQRFVCRRTETRHLVEVPCTVAARADKVISWLIIAGGGKRLFPEVPVGLAMIQIGKDRFPLHCLEVDIVVQVMVNVLQPGPGLGWRRIQLPDGTATPLPRPVGFLIVVVR